MFSSTSSDIDLHAAVIADPSGTNPAWREIVIRIRPAIRKGLLGLYDADREDAESFALAETFRVLPSVDPDEIATYSLAGWARRVAARAGRRDATRERYKGIDDKKVALARKVSAEINQGLTVAETAQSLGVSIEDARSAVAAVTGYETAFGEEAFEYEATPAAEVEASDGLALVARVVADLVGSDHPDYSSLLTLTGTTELGTAFGAATKILDVGKRDVEELRNRLRRTLAAKFPEATKESLRDVTAAYLRGEVAA